MPLDQNLDQNETNRINALNAKPVAQRTPAESAELTALNAKKNS